MIMMRNFFDVTVARLGARAWRAIAR